jgi:Flp pilus assembly pilin Flp
VTGFHQLRPRRPERGAALVEFALVLPVFSLILFAIVQFALVFTGWDELRNRTQFVAQQAASGALPCHGSVTACEKQMTSEIGALVGTSGSVNVVYYYPGGDGSAELIVCTWAPAQALPGFPAMTVHSTSAFFVANAIGLPPTDQPRPTPWGHCGP